jgi:hypothetical protein
MPNFFLLWLPSRIFEKKIDLCENYAEIRAFDGISFYIHLNPNGTVPPVIASLSTLTGRN